ncbi:MAG: AMIN domain-containing protein, partial [Acidobacteriota bacterium]|nr:AMIN domain-containing protein [Acidobacteriota bacterium]
MLCLVTAYVEGFTQDAQTGAVPMLRAVRVVAEPSGGSTTVILEADGPLPVPLSGALDGPPRIYLDLNGVRPGPAARLAESSALVLRARVALHSANPISTRVVLDLSRPTPYRIDASGRAQGRLTIVLGVPPSAPAPAPPPVPTHTQTTIPPRAT